ncbi:MAG: YidC/Oxa1 family insertase periplasmic-domain containing protein [Planctomycetota bacterium]
MQQSSDRKNFAMFMIMVAVALLVYSMYFRPRPQPRPQPAPGGPGTTTDEPTTPGTDAPKPPAPAAEDIGGEKEPTHDLIVTTEEMAIRLSSQGASIEKLSLPKHHPSAKSKLPLVLLDRDVLQPKADDEKKPAPKRQYPRRRSMVITDVHGGRDFENWNWKLVRVTERGRPKALPASGSEFTFVGTATVEYLARRGDHEIRKIYTFNDEERNYDIGVEVVVVNRGAERRKINYKLIGAAGLVLDEPEGRFSMISAVLAGRENHRADLHRVKLAVGDAPKYIAKGKEEKLRVSKRLTEWAALRGRYFAATIFPEDPGKEGVISAFAEPLDPKEQDKKRMNLAVGLKANDHQLEPGGEISHRYVMRVGPQRIAELDRYSYTFTLQNGKMPVVVNRGLVKSVDFGFEWFAWLSRLLLKLLLIIRSLVGSYGVSIVLLTLVVKILLHPLSLKSQKSMQRMQELQPKIQALQKQLKNDPQKLQQAQMRLFKEEGVNPASGCLPMLLQMPVFFGLWGAIRGAFVFRQAPFLWIDDLSRPDMLFTMDFWPHSFNLLPILYAVLMVVQMMSQPLPKEGQARQQAMMMRFMPLLFFFIFYHMASAFVLYFTSSSVFGLIESRITKRQLAKAKEAREAAAGGAPKAPSNGKPAADAPPPDPTAFWQAEGEKKKKGKKGKR